MRAKLIDNPDYFPLQDAWFAKQVNGANGAVFKNFALAERSFNNAKGSMNLPLDAEQLLSMRGELNEKGLKLLSNAIAAHKKREKKKAAPGVVTKKLQADIDVTTLAKLNAYCNAQNKDQATVLTELINTLW